MYLSNQEFLVAPAMVRSLAITLKFKQLKDCFCELFVVASDVSWRHK
ncbi:hypothetical protein F7734_21765 [Scytonema sp. UIC 10036]|nr:hypothetical protein [Scytonema sp. UIC 10036]MUG94845.1 hypothetical protein [Scytonema sp. UIC 10036]